MVCTACGYGCIIIIIIKVHVKQRGTEYICVYTKKESVTIHTHMEMCINININQSYTALSPMLEVTGNIILKVTKEQFLVENSSSCYAILGSSLLNCSIYFQIIGPSFPWSSPWTSHSPQTLSLPACHLTFLPFFSTTLSFSSPLSILLRPAPISI